MKVRFIFKGGVLSLIDVRLMLIRLMLVGMVSGLGLEILSISLLLLMN